MTFTARKPLGPNHKDGCDGRTSYLSGDGYNTVRVCSCGAEDHEPTDESIRRLLEIDDPFADDLRLDECEVDLSAARRSSNVVRWIVGAVVVAVVAAVVVAVAAAAAEVVR